MASTEAAKAASRAHYRRNRERYIENNKRWKAANPEKVVEAQRAFRNRRLDRIDAIKVDSGCVECGFNDHPAALQFHHRDEEQKVSNVAGIVNSRWEVVEEEIAKCDVLCANCHSIYHYSRGKDF